MNDLAVLALVGSLFWFAGFGCGNSDDSVSYVKNDGSYCLPEAENRTEDCFIGGSEELVSVGGDSLEGIEQICNSKCNKIKLLSISNAKGLKNLKAFRGIEVTKYLSIGSNDHLKTTQGLQARNGIRLVVNGNRALQSITVLDGLTSVSGVTIENNPNVSEIVGLGDIDEAKQLVLAGTSLENLQQLNGLELGMKSSFAVAGNPNIRKMPELSGEARFIEIYNNRSLTDVSGVSGLGKIWGGLGITDNPNLKNCEAQQLTEDIEFYEDAKIEINKNGSGSCPQ